MNPISSAINYIRSRKNARSSTIFLYDKNNISTFLYKNIYSLPEVRNAINTVAEFFAVMPARHLIVHKNGEVEKIDSDIAKVLNVSANELQTPTQFWINVVTRYLLYNYVAIQIIYDSDGLHGLYPLPFKRPKIELPHVIFLDDSNGSKYKLADLIILSRFSDFDKTADNSGLSLHETIIQAIQNRALKNATNNKRVVAAVKSSLTSGINSRIKEGDKQAKIKEMAVQLKESEIEGFVNIDGGSEIVPLNIPDIKIERELLALIIETVNNYFNINEKIIKGIATEIEIEQFILKLKPFVKMCGEELTRKLLDSKEINRGSRIDLDIFELKIYLLKDIIALGQSGIRQGYLNQDESRKYLGLSPLPDGLGQKYRVPLDTVDLTIADEVQLNKLYKTGG